MTEPTYGSLFAGSGGLTLGLKAVLGGTSVWYAENDPAARAVLALREPGIPNLGDVTTVDWASVPPVDILDGGSPCQDISMAGRRAGIAPGNRSGLWSAMCDAIETIRPALVVWENVRGALSARTERSEEVVRVGPRGGRAVEVTERALGRVLGDLAELRYDAWWCGVRASDVGAAHARFRIFVFATPADAAHLGHEGCGPARGRGDGSAHGGDAAADVRREWGKYGPAIARWETVTGRPSPPPTAPGRHGKPRLSIRFVEWLMGFPAGYVTDTPGLSRSDQLKILGNAVVPLQAAWATALWSEHARTVPTSEAVLEGAR